MQMKTTLILFTILLSSCTSYNFSRITIQQGNLLTAEKIEHLKLGTSKADAALIMGTSLINPLFNQDRWDYAYTWQNRSGDMKIRTVILYFKNDKLIKIDNRATS